MRNLEIEKKMYDTATDFITTRFPKGWGGAAVIHTQQGSFFTSTALESANSSVLLCIEAGAMCEAHKYNEKVTHCLCVVRDDEYSPFKVLSPCGVCQERLRYWGEDVQVGVTTGDGTLLFVTLKELQPYHWTTAYPKSELEHYEHCCKSFDIHSFWRDVLKQDADAIRAYFNENAYVNWHNTNEHFTVEEFITANCEYPGSWDGEIERVERVGNLIITATHVYTTDKSLSFHVTSFTKTSDGKISSVDEYWGDDDAAPQWRLDKHIGTKIR